MELGIATFPAIVVVCWMIGYGFKQSSVNDKWIPLIVGVTGALVGAIGYATGVVPAQNYLDAIVIGIVSGEASTGVHQVYKQLTKEV